MPRLSTRRAVDSRLAVLPSTTRIMRGTTTLGSRCSQPCTFCRSCMTEGTDGTPSTIPQVRGMDRQDLLRRVADENIRTVRFLYCDHGNIVRGKAVHASALPDFLESGVGLSVAMQAFTLTDHLASGTSLGPVGEIRLVPDRRTFAVLPYAPREARLLCDMYTLDGQPWELCPRAFLRQTIDRVAEQGLRIEAAFEYEFYLARQADDGRFVPADDSLCFSSDGMDRAGTVVGVLTHLPGLLAVTCPSVNSYLRLAPDMWSSAYTCWGPDNREAAVRVASPFHGRVEASTNIEVKAVDGSANPYLALGAIVAAGLDGIERGLDPGEPVAFNPHDLSDSERSARGIRRYPTTLLEALKELEKDELLLDATGAARAHEFVGVRRAEWADLGR